MKSLEEQNRARIELLKELRKKVLALFDMPIFVEEDDNDDTEQSMLARHIGAIIWEIDEEIRGRTL